MRAIAARMHVSQATICRDVHKIQEDFRKRHHEDVDLWKQKQVDALERIFETAMAAWEASHLPVETITTRTGLARLDREGGITELPQEVSHSITGQTGNSAYLEKAMKALADIRAILGLDAPKRSDITSGGEPIKAYVGVDLDQV